MLKLNRYQLIDGRYDYRELREMAERINKARHLNAKRLCREAGLDDGLLGIHPYNAMCSYAAGKPWPEVNYSKCRATIREIERSFEGTRVLNAMYDRLGYDRFYWGY